VLLLHGRHDYVVPVGLAEALAAGHPAASLRIFEASGHQPFVEEPGPFVAAIAEWLDRERAQRLISTIAAQRRVRTRGPSSEKGGTS
jgi:alpha-beta hydrolase superfamily lysophospholipase